ncbi:MULTISPECIES: acyltransferase family protein [Planktothricoides]|uniref:Acyltransferase n=1 Tax=Planktothricoides raciborskii FACHB-1370 TaxID=2949576 RepID=A0ABR8EGW2_9CYAN|nr:MULTISPECIES: acyltransferase [Planktothricoides]KOR35968.1 hypothetical protein AM228_15300 [Planktothricoides sp. SR001]MBD2546094.1 acyltransferase [Planktothricoides raciborskii FACHB-1370]MBD2583757.1 acyltransferase [Planktothricoides raciborskii FACHB-1261]
MTNYQKNEPNHNRFKSLDILRAIAVLLVLGRHKFISEVWYIAGWTGVDLFFLLSGFLVGGILFREYKKTGKINFYDFLSRRGIRIYLPFYLLIAVTILYNLICQQPFKLASVGAELFFVQNYFLGLWNHTWYLAVDQHFYVIVLPICLISLCHFSKDKADPFKAIVPLVVAIAILMLLVRIVTEWYIPYTNHYLHHTHLRLDSLSFGVLLAYLHNFHQAKFSQFIQRRMNSILIVSIFFLSPCLVLDLEKSVFMHEIGVTFVDLGFGGLICFLLYWQPHLPKGNPIHKIIEATTDAIAFIGLNSYSIYLWHMPVAKWVVEWIKEISPHKIHFVVEFWLYLFGSILLGIFMAQLIEHPVIKLRDRLYPSRPNQT